MSEMAIREMDELASHENLLLFIEYSYHPILVWRDANVKKIANITGRYTSDVQDLRKNFLLPTGIMFVSDDLHFRTFCAVQYHGRENFLHSALTELEAKIPSTIYYFETHFEEFYHFEEWTNMPVSNDLYFAVFVSSYKDGEWDQRCAFRRLNQVVEEYDVPPHLNAVCVHGSAYSATHLFLMLEKYKGPLKRVLTHDDIVHICLATLSM